MKKEAVSRSLRRLSEKHYISKQRLQQDERSYVMALTPEGEQALAQCYGPILQPLYELKRKMGAEFDRLMSLLHQANCLMGDR